MRLPAFLRRRPPRSPLSLAQRAFCLLLILGPTIVLGGKAVEALIRQIDGILAQAAPIAASEATRILGREVRVGTLKTDLTAGGIVGILRRLRSFGTVPVFATGIQVANGPTIAGSGLLASVPQGTIEINIPALLSGKATTDGLPLIDLNDPYLLLVRAKDGSFNVTKILPPKPPNQPATEPFRTYINVHNGRLTFRDYASRIATSAAPFETNYLDTVSGYADLLGSRDFRFSGTARAQPNTVSARRLTGGLSVDGFLGRGLPGTRPNAPSAGSARFAISLHAKGADATYWVPYFVTVPTFQIAAGRANVDVNLTGPRPNAPQGPSPQISLALGAAFTGGKLITKAVPVPLTDAAGTASYSDGTLTFDATGKVIGEPVTGTGTVWNLPTAPTPGTPVASGPASLPRFAVHVSAPHIPVATAVHSFLPGNVKLPAGIRFEGIGTLQAAINGTPQQPIVTAAVALPEGRIGYDGYPGLTHLAANVTYAGGLVGLTNLTGQIEGGGTIEGRLGVRVFGSGTGDSAEKGNAVFSVHGRDLSLSRLASLRGLTGLKVAARPLRIAGQGDVELIGKRVNGTLSAAANITTKGLALAEIPFPVASARVVLNQGVVTVPAARIVSPVGLATIHGGLGRRSDLSLSYHLTGIDIGRIADALGLDGITGIVSASGTVSGTTASPRVLIDRAVAMNLHMRIGGQPARNGNLATPVRRFAIDTVTIRNAEVTPSALLFEEPLLIRRYPAVAAVSGRLSNLRLFGGKGPAPTPYLRLTARVNNLDYAEVLHQFGLEPVAAPGVPSSLTGTTDTADSAPIVIPTPGTSAARSAAQTRRLNPTGIAASVRGFITQSTVQVDGPLTAPRVSAAAELGRLLIGPYPIDGGYIRFAYGPEGASIPEMRLRASVGVVTGSAGLSKSGVISGKITGDGLDLAPLAFLTGGTVGLSGKVSIGATLGGDSHTPTVTAHILPSTVNVAGTALTDLRADQIRLRYNTADNAMTATAPELSFSLEGTQVAVRNARYEASTGRFGADLHLDTPDIGVLLDTLRRSDLAGTPSGAAFVRGLDSLPYPIGGKILVDRLAVSGRIANGALTERSLTADIRATSLRVGEYTADSISLGGSLHGDLARLDQLQIVSQDTTIRGSGTVDLAPQGQMNVVLETNQASLDIVRALPGMGAFPVRGHVDVSVSARGLTKSPMVTASLEGRDLAVGQPPPTPKPAVNGAPAIAQTATTPPPNPAVTATSGPTLMISLLRAEGALVQDDKQDEKTPTVRRYRLVVPDVLIRSGDNEISGEADLPVAFGDPNGALSPDRPISVRANITRLDLASLIPTIGSQAGLSGFKARGDVRGSVALTGVLNKPNLDGNITLDGGQVTFPVAPGSGRDRINPISSIDANILFRGDTIDFSQFRVALGPPNGQKGNFGNIAVTGGVHLQNLQDIQRLFGATSGRGRQNRPINIQGNTDLRVAFNSLKPVLENITAMFGNAAPTGLGEAFRATVDGNLKITGPVTRPTIATEEGAPLRLTDTYVQLPTRAGPPPTPNVSTPAINPAFNIDIDFPRTATVAQARSFRLDAVGGVHVDGSLALPKITSTLTPTGGYYNYALARFIVKKGGDVTVSYQVTDGLKVTLDQVIASTKVYAPNGTTPTLAVRASDPSAAFGSAQPPISTNSNKYTITIQIDGQLLLGQEDSGGGISTGTGPRLTFSSDPYLTQEEIIALIGTTEQIALAARGDLSGAVQLGAEQALYSGLVPQALAPLESSVASAFGLEEFGLEYNPDAPVLLRFVKRLPDPLDRFIVEITRSFITRQLSQPIQPYTFRISYEIYQLHPTRGVRPRLQLGVEQDDQRVFTTFLRGTINY